MQACFLYIEASIPSILRIIWQNECFWAMGGGFTNTPVSSVTLHVIFCHCVTFVWVQHTWGVQHTLLCVAPDRDMWSFQTATTEATAKWIQFTLLLTYIRRAAVCLFCLFVMSDWNGFTVSLRTCELAHLHTVVTWEFREITLFPFCMLLFVCFSLCFLTPQLSLISVSLWVVAHTCG